MFSPKVFKVLAKRQDLQQRYVDLFDRLMKAKGDELDRVIDDHEAFKLEVEGIAGGQA